MFWLIRDFLPFYSTLMFILVVMGVGKGAMTHPLDFYTPFLQRWVSYFVQVTELQLPGKKAT